MDKVVGNPDCDFLDVKSAILDEFIAEPVTLKHCPEFGRKLGLSNLSIDQLEKEHDNKEGIHCIVDDILRKWRHRMGNDATLKYLINVLEELGISEAVHKLKTKFGTGETKINVVCQPENKRNDDQIEYISEANDKVITDRRNSIFSNNLISSNFKVPSAEQIAVIVKCNEPTKVGKVEKRVIYVEPEIPEKQSFISSGPSSKNITSSEIKSGYDRNLRPRHSFNWTCAQTIEWQCITCTIILLFTVCIIAGFPAYFLWIKGSSNKTLEKAAIPLKSSEIKERVIFVESYMEYMQKLRNLTRLERIDLRLALHQSDKWPTGVAMYNSSQIYKLRVKGYVSVALLSEILNQTVNLEFLGIDNELNKICDYNKGEQISLAKPFNLSQLRVLIFNEITECSEVIKTFALKLEAAKLQRFIVNKGNLQHDDIQEIQAILTKVKDTIQYLKLNANYVKDMFDFMARESFQQLQNASISEYEIAPTPNYYNLTIVDREFCKAVPDLMELTSNNFVSIESFMHVLHCKNLKRLKIGIYFNGNETLFNVNIDTRLANLTAINIFLYFQNCPNASDIAILELHNSGNRWKCFSLASNCPMLACESVEDKCEPIFSLRRSGRHCDADRKLLTTSFNIL